IKPGAFAGLAPATPWERSRQVKSKPSTAIRPVQLARAIAASMPGARPSEMVKACVAAGINKATATAQVRKYRKVLAESNN
ncbi:MAG TPA: hypothetical protein VFV18_07345, partial [Porticoccaceae bacterium]|nr:hypothetical protein [Porticoccaceae bacterium]